MPKSPVDSARSAAKAPGGWSRSSIGSERGQGTLNDLEMIEDMCGHMKGVTICVLSDACAMPVETMIQKFRSEFEYHITEKRCMVSH